MRFAESSPPPAAQPFAECYWTLTSEGAGDSRDAGLIAPDGSVELVFGVDEDHVSLPFATVGGARENARHGYVLGITTRPQYAEHAGKANLFGIRLGPAAALAIFGADLGQFSDSAVSIDDVARGFGRRVSDALQKTDRFQQITSALLDTIAASTRREQTRLARLMARILASGGDTPLTELARDAAISTRQMDRWFARFVGVPPKLFGRIARFRRAWRLACAAPRADWALLAARCGYADQAHLCREFREFSGLSPGQLGRAP